MRTNAKHWQLHILKPLKQAPEDAGSLLLYKSPLTPTPTIIHCCDGGLKCAMPKVISSLLCIICSFVNGDVDTEGNICGEATWRG